MPSPGPWRVLPLQIDNGIPLLLASYTFAVSSYTVFLSDLSSVWTESLDRRNICMRGFREETSIDPSDGEENMSAFLKALTRAFDDSEPDHEQTSITMAPGITAVGNSQGVDGTDGFTLTVTCQLPAELRRKPLKWNMYLRKCPAPEIASRLILPLIEAHREKEAQVDTLVKAVQQKDAIIARLLDKMDAMETPLENVFTIATTGKRGLTREVAYERIGGLAPFNKEAWLQKVKDRIPETTDAVELVEATLHEAQLKNSLTTFDNMDGLDRWWANIVPGSGGPRENQLRRLRSPVSTLSQEDNIIKDTPTSSGQQIPTRDDDDEVIPDSLPLPTTPRKLQSRSGIATRTRPIPDSDEEDITDSEDLDDGFDPAPATPSTLHKPPPVVNSSPPAHPSPSKRAGGIGKIGGQKAASAVAPTPAPPGDEDRDITMSIDKDSSAPKLPPKKPAASLGRIGKIGKVGGPSKVAAPPVDVDATMSLSKYNEDFAGPETPISEAKPAVSRKIGKIGGAMSKKVVKSSPPKETGAINGMKRMSENSDPGSATASESEGETKNKSKEKGKKKEKNKLDVDGGEKSKPQETPKPFIRKVGGRPLVKKRKF